jgi:hypothetical protein
LIRIAITQAAFDAIAATLPLGSVSYENQFNERNERYVWLPPDVVNRLKAQRRPGENYSDAILQLVETEGGRAGRPILYSLPRRRCYARHGVDRPAGRHAGPRSLLPRLLSARMEARPCSSL